MITALAGGVGAARFLNGLIGIVLPSEICAVVNTADDIILHGLHISPDLDTVTYSLAGQGDPVTGWGLGDETWEVMSALERYGGETWFRLGDRDLATHLYRTHRLSQGLSLSEVTAELVSSWGIGVKVLPMTDQPVRTMVTLAGGTEIGFQDYFVRLHHDVAVESVRFEGAESASPGPGVLDAIREAELLAICPSNPIVSIGPMLAVPGIEDALRERREHAVAISPIVAGSAIKGPADRLMAELGHEPSVVGVARLYSHLVSTLVIDQADTHLAPVVEAEGVHCVVTQTIMSNTRAAENLARVVLSEAAAL